MSIICVITRIDDNIVIVTSIILFRTAEYIRCNKCDNQNSYNYQILLHRHHKRKCVRNVKRVASRTRMNSWEFNKKLVCWNIIDARTSSCAVEHDANLVEAKNAFVADCRCFFLLVELYKIFALQVKDR